MLAKLQNLISFCEKLEKYLSVPKTSLMKSVLELGCVYESILKYIKIQYHTELTSLYQIIYYAKSGRDRAFY